jgi:hypothetical protein
MGNVPSVPSRRPLSSRIQRSRTSCFRRPGMREFQCCQDSLWPASAGSTRRNRNTGSQTNSPAAWSSAASHRHCHTCLFLGCRTPPAGSRRRMHKAYPSCNNELLPLAAAIWVGCCTREDALDQNPDFSRLGFVHQHRCRLTSIGGRGNVKPIEFRHKQ